ncbi:MAG TPA: class I SAM-dependent methyltransferase [Burkholderiaceae bacterium]|nr:class I SAM-dependent methyltransferase [Burkholderiaceae bacterium]
MNSARPTDTPTRPDRRRLLLGAASAPVLAMPALARAQTTNSPNFVPQVGQAGKDVIWVPTPDGLVDRMLRMAQVGPNDRVVDLGAGDGKIVIAAARDFGANSLGVEFNPDMVALARRNAERAGVAGRARFEQGDIFKVDFTDASVVTMYLLPSLNMKLRPQLLRMRPGTRLVTHQFTFGSWEPDDSSTVDGRPGYLWIVPAPVGGGWKMTTTDGRGNSEAMLSFTQAFQQVGATARMSSMEGKLRSVRLSGDRLSFELMDDRGVLRAYDGRVAGDRIEGSTRAVDGTAGTFSASRTSPATPVDGGRE